MWVLNISCARFEKYRSKLHIFRSLVADLRFARIYPLGRQAALLWEHKCSVVARLVQASTKQIYLLL